MTSAGLCSSFYTAFTNELTRASALASTFNVQGMHKSCQAAATKNQDRFIFTPRYVCRAVSLALRCRS